uniref:DUF155 domain-containing protein n=1 Tax=Trichuris muris TaxID=70415 RepID=A0A5S6QEM8_TRIMR
MDSMRLLFEMGLFRPQRPVLINSACRRFIVRKLSDYKSIPSAEVTSTKRVRASRRPTYLLPEVSRVPQPNVWAYTTAESFHMKRLARSLGASFGFTALPLSVELSNVLRLVPNQLGHPGEAFVFAEGAVVSWDLEESDRLDLLARLKPFEESSYETEVVEGVVDNLSYIDNGMPRSEFKCELLLLRSSSTEVERSLDKYAVSNAMMCSVKLSVWETLLSEFVDALESVVEQLKLGRISLSKSEVLRRAGELFMLRHRINLDSDLLDTPDFYWDKEDLERLYSDAFSLFNIGKRTRVLNVRLTYCMELLQLLDSNIAHRHSVRLEVMIILLILVEVLFEMEDVFYGSYLQVAHFHGKMSNQRYAVRSLNVPLLNVNASLVLLLFNGRRLSPTVAAIPCKIVWTYGHKATGITLNAGYTKMLQRATTVLKIKMRNNSDNKSGCLNKSVRLLPPELPQRWHLVPA